MLHRMKAGMDDKSEVLGDQAVPQRVLDHIANDTTDTGKQV
jgi:hypothetical protein